MRKVIDKLKIHAYKGIVQKCSWEIEVFISKNTEFPYAIFGKNAIRSLGDDLGSKKLYAICRRINTSVLLNLQSRV